MPAVRSTNTAARFDAALATAAANITETGEREVVESIRRGRDEYYRRFDAFLSTTGDRAAVYFESLEPRFNDVRAAADRLLRLNQEAMRRKADAASRTARRWFFDHPCARPHPDGRRRRD